MSVYYACGSIHIAATSEITSNIALTLFLKEQNYITHTKYTNSLDLDVNLPRRCIEEVVPDAKKHTPRIIF